MLKRVLRQLTAVAIVMIKFARDSDEMILMEVCGGVCHCFVIASTHEWFSCL